MKGFLTLCFWLAVWWVIIRYFTSCSLTVAADGSRTWALDGAQAARAIVILSEK